MRAAVAALGTVAIAAAAIGCGGAGADRHAAGPVRTRSHARPDRERQSLGAMRASQPGFRMLEGEVSLASDGDAPDRGTFFSDRRLDSAISASATAAHVRLARVDCVAGRYAADHREFFCGIVFVDGSEGQAIARVSLDGRRWRLGPMRLE